MVNPMALHPSLDILFPYASAIMDPDTVSEFSLSLTEIHTHLKA